MGRFAKSALCFGQTLNVTAKFLKEHGLTFEDAAKARQAASGDHNRRETPLFAESIARRARAKAQERAK